MRFTLIAFTLTVCIAGCGQEKPAPRLSDFKRPTVLDLIRETKDPIRADLEKVLARAMKIYAKDPDEVTARELFGWLGDANRAIIDAWKGPRRPVEDPWPSEIEKLYMTALQESIKLSQELKTVPSQVDRDRLAERIAKALNADKPALQPPSK